MYVLIVVLTSATLDAMSVNVALPDVSSGSSASEAVARLSTSVTRNVARASEMGATLASIAALAPATSSAIAAQPAAAAQV